MHIMNWHWNWLCNKFFMINIFIFIATISSIEAGDIHGIGKRQIGVLARTGALPQGKRSVEVLARNGELPPSSGKKLAAGDQTLDSLVEELDSEEAVSRLRLRALAQKLLEQSAVGDSEKRSVAALARNGELPQKRQTDVGARSGYLIKLPQETARPPKDLFDPDDFLEKEKRASVFGRNFLLWRKEFRPQAGAGSYVNKNLRDFERDGRSYPTDYGDWVDGFDSDDFRFEVKKNVGASKNFGKREARGNCLLDLATAKSRLRESKGGVGSAGARFKRDAFWGRAEDEGDVVDADADEDAVEKRFLGRIPQLGRIHQKAQSPSMRRRPHLRPNWF